MSGAGRLARRAPGELATSTEKWSAGPGVVLRLSMDSTGAVEVADAFEGARVTLGRDEVIEQIGRGPSGPLSSSRDEDTAADLAHWRERNWGWILPYYLWSRRPASAPGTTSPSPPPAQDQRVGIALPAAQALSGGTLGKAFWARSTTQRPQGEPTALTALSTLLWHATRRQTAGPGSSTAPVELDIYVLAYDVSELPSGVYAYRPGDHDLALVQQGQFRERTSQLMCNQPAPLLAAFTVVLAANFSRFQSRHPGERGLRDLYLHTGRLAQRVGLIGAGLGIQFHISPAVADGGMCELLHLDPVDHDVLFNLSGR
jgi:SagB-type dehydrogenase family enzyme